MMDSMRNAAKTWVAKVLIGLLAVSFGVWGIADVFRTGTTTELVTVGDTTITGEQFNTSFSEYLQNVARQSGQALTPEEARNLGIDKAILDNLMQSAALDNEAAHLKLGVSSDFLAKDIMTNPAFQDAAGKFSADRFKQLLAQNGLSETGFFSEERQRLLRQALTETATAGLPVNKGLLEAQYRYDNEQRDARYFIITTQDSEVAAPTEDEIKAEYEANPAAYTAPEYRSVAIMTLEPADVAAKVVLTEEDISLGYDKYKADYFTPETRTILQISFPTLEDAEAAKAKLAAGTDFLALATERGFTEQDVTFANKTKADFVDPAVADAAFALAEGAVSEPIKGKLSTVLLKAQTITPEKQSTLDEVKQQLTERLKLERAGEEIQAVYDAVEDDRAAQTAFEQIAEKTGLPFQIIPATDPQGKDKDGKDIDAPQIRELLQATFSSDVGVENDAISMDDGYVWYEVREVVPAALRPLDTVKDQVKAAVTARKVQALSEEKAKKLVERARAGAKLDDLATEAQATVQTAQALRRRESDAAFGLAAVNALFAVPDNGFAYALEPDGRGARIMQSAPVLLPAFDASSPDAAKIAERLNPQLADNLLSSYLTELQSEAGVKLNETLWRNISGQQTN